MNRFTSTLIAAAFVAAAGQALADDITVETQPFFSTATRAQVQAELVEFKTQRNPWSTSFNPLAGFESGLTREEVRAEYVASRDAVASFVGEDSGSSALAQGQQRDSYLASAAAESGGAQ